MSQLTFNQAANESLKQELLQLVLADVENYFGAEYAKKKSLNTKESFSKRERFIPNGEWHGHGSVSDQKEFKDLAEPNSEYAKTPKLKGVFRPLSDPNINSSTEPLDQNKRRGFLFGVDRYKNRALRRLGVLMVYIISTAIPLIAAIHVVDMYNNRAVGLFGDLGVNIATDTIISLTLIVTIRYMCLLISGPNYAERYIVKKAGHGNKVLSGNVSGTSGESSTDHVLQVISESYFKLHKLRIERERQGKYSFNTALGLIIVGVLIIFIGVVLLIQKKLTAGIITSSAGSVSSIIGGTIMKIYKDTNDRMDEVNKSLFKLETAKAEYSIILGISDPKLQNKELVKLINSIRNINQIT